MWQGHHKKRHFFQKTGNLCQSVSKIDLRFTWIVNQRHEYFLLAPFNITHSFPYLRVSTLVSRLFYTLIYPLGCVPLLFGLGFVAFNDLSNLLKVCTDLRLRTGSLHPVTGQLRILQYLC